jgi:RNA polymerase sigma factor (sigma-70 family)
MCLLKRLPALEGRDVNFIAYALTTARNACYDTIEAKRRVQPVAEQLEPRGSEPGEVALDPERAALLASAREDVRVANARLPERQREVLALRELELMSYEQIGEVVGLNTNAVAQLISRARIRLREQLRGGALQSIAASSPDCERALPLMARLQDTQSSTAEEREWLQTHLSSCETCGLSRAAMEEAGVSYRALGPIVPLVWLRHTTIARAARFVGADWSHLAGSGHGRTVSSTPSMSPTNAHVRSTAHIADTPHGGLSSWIRGVAGRRPHSVDVRAGIGVHRRLRRLLATVVLCTILAVVLAASVARDSRVLSPRVTSALGPAATSHAGGRPHVHAIGSAHRAGASVSTALAPKRGSAALVSAAGEAGQPSGATPAIHHAHRGSHRRSTHPAHHPPIAPTSKTPPPSPPPPQPAATTPTTPSPSAPSSGSGGSTGSGSGSGTGAGETPTTPTETSGSPPGGSTGTGSGGTETGHGCAIAIACP